MAKYKINREPFIRYVSRGYLGSLIQQNTMIDDLIKGGEYVLTAEDILQMKDQWPGYLVEGEAPHVVDTKDCELIYHQ